MTKDVTVCLSFKLLHALQYAHAWSAVWAPAYCAELARFLKTIILQGIV